MTYVANPTDSTRPLDSDDASGGAAELRALKAYLAGLITGGSSFLAYGLAGFRNKLTNGNFDVWQRGTSLGSAVNNAYLADHWANEGSGSTTVISQQSHTLGQVLVPLEPRFFHRTVVTSVAGAGNFSNFRQRVESVRTFAGQTATISFYAKADAIKNIAIEVSQNFGTGGSPSAAVNSIGVTTKTLSTTFALYTVTVAVPSITGKTIGTNGDDFLQLTFWYEAGSTFNSRTNSLGQQSGTFDISEVQMEAGGVNTPFELLPADKIISSCQRYYWRRSSPASQSLGVNGQCFASNTAIVVTDHPTAMRAAPTPNLSNVALLSAAGAVVNAVSFSLHNSTLDQISLNVVTGGSLVGGNATVLLSATGSAGFIECTAEL